MPRTVAGKALEAGNGGTFASVLWALIGFKSAESEVQGSGMA